MTRYTAGRKFEYDVRDFLKKKYGYTVVRAAGSHGLADLIAWKGNDVLLIQCKKEKKKASYKEELEALRSLQVPRGWVKQLWVKRDREGVSVLDIGHFPNQDTVFLLTAKEFNGLA
jgi:Holliday junction resolvase